MISDNMTAREIIDKVISNNTEDHDILKLAEECTELSEVLIKMVTKPNKRSDKIPHLIEEIGDVKLRMDILMQRLNILAAVNARVINKLMYVNESVHSKKYANS